MSWSDAAACRGEKTALFFQAEDAPRAWVAQAKQLCATCPVQVECLVHAIDHHEEGLWGGLTANERDQLATGPRGPRIAARSCRECGVTFRGTAQAQLCDPCRVEVRKVTSRLAKQRARAGAS